MFESLELNSLHVSHSDKEFAEDFYVYIVTHNNYIKDETKRWFISVQSNFFMLSNK